jgi:hypothetical protein
MDRCAPNRQTEFSAYEAVSECICGTSPMMLFSCPFDFGQQQLDPSPGSRAVGRNCGDRGAQWACRRRHFRGCNSRSPSLFTPYFHHSRSEWRRWSRLAQRYLADEVEVPIGTTCCGTAGDRGLLHPQLVLSATREIRSALDARPAEAYLSANRACEMGLRHATGRPMSRSSSCLRNSAVLPAAVTQLRQTQRRGARMAPGADVGVLSLPRSPIFVRPRNEWVHAAASNRDRRRSNSDLSCAWREVESG